MKTKMTDWKALVTEFYRLDHADDPNSLMLGAPAPDGALDALASGLGIVLPDEGRIFLSVSNRHKIHAAKLAQRLVKLGYEIIATSGTAKAIQAEGIPVERVKKIKEGHPNLLDHLIDGNVALILNTPNGKGARTDEGRIRASAVQHGVPCITTIQAAEAAVQAIEALRNEEMNVMPIQDRIATATVL